MHDITFALEVVPRYNSLISVMFENLATKRVHSTLLTKLCDQILDFTADAARW